MSKHIIASIVTLTILLIPTLALAAPDASAGALAISPLAKAIAIGLAALGGGLGQGRAAAAALEGICRNPNSAKVVMTPMILGLAFIESLVVFALVVVFMI